MASEQAIFTDREDNLQANKNESSDRYAQKPNLESIKVVE